MSFIRILILLIILPLVTGCSDEESSSSKKNAVTNNNSQSTMDRFTLASTEFSDGGEIPPDCACKWLGGENRPPVLRWINTPPTTESFALIMEDETGNKGDKATRHWSVFNIPATVTDTDKLKEQAAAEITEGRNYTNENNYAGPCPPKKHQYTFTVFALNGKMPFLPPGKEFTKSQFMREYNYSIIDAATISGTYKPSQSRLLFNKIKRKIRTILSKF